MKTLKDQFIPYELAVKIKELGFNEKCFDLYADTKGKSLINSITPRNRIPKILWQQAFEFLEDKYKLYSTIDNVVLSYGIVDCRNEVKIVKSISYDDTFKTRKEVKYACLNQLINLIKL